MLAPSAGLVHRACYTKPMFDADINAGNDGIYKGIGLFHETYSSIYKIRWMLWFCFMAPLMGYLGMKRLCFFLDHGFPTFVLGLPDQGVNNWLCWARAVAPCISEKNSALYISDALVCLRQPPSIASTIHGGRICLIPLLTEGTSFYLRPWNFK